jgi:hypothetical protein
LTGAISDERIPHKVKDRTLLQATGLNDRQDAFDKAVARIRLSPMRVTPPEHGVTQGTFGAVVRWLKAGYGDKTPQIGISRQQATTRLGCARRRGLQADG